MWRTSLMWITYKNLDDIAIGVNGVIPVDGWLHQYLRAKDAGIKILDYEACNETVSNYFTTLSTALVRTGTRRTFVNEDWVTNRIEGLPNIVNINEYTSDNVTYIVTELFVVIKGVSNTLINEHPKYYKISNNIHSNTLGVFVNKQYPSIAIYKDTSAPFVHTPEIIDAFAPASNAVAQRVMRLIDCLEYEAKTVTREGTCGDYRVSAKGVYANWSEKNKTFTIHSKDIANDESLFDFHRASGGFKFRNIIGKKDKEENEAYNARPTEQRAVTGIPVQLVNVPNAAGGHDLVALSVDGTWRYVVTRD